MELARMIETKSRSFSQANLRIAELDVRHHLSEIPATQKIKDVYAYYTPGLGCSKLDKANPGLTRILISVL